MTKSHLLFLIFNLEPENVLVNTKIKFFCTHEETGKSTFDASHSCSHISESAGLDTC